MEVETSFYFQSQCKQLLQSMMVLKFSKKSVNLDQSVNQSMLPWHVPDPKPVKDCVWKCTALKNKVIKSISTWIKSVLLKKKKKIRNSVKFKYSFWSTKPVIYHLIWRVLPAWLAAVLWSKGFGGRERISSWWSGWCQLSLKLKILNQEINLTLLTYLKSVWRW